jgi:hypothetical protein
MQEVIFALFLAFFISATEYVSKSLNLKRKRYYSKILSFSAGISATYILLELLPLFAETAFSISKFLFLALLFGFISHHIAEKEIYKHNKKHELIKKLSLEENIFYYAYHTILGIVLVTFFKQNVLEGLFFGFSILAFTIASNLPSTPHRSNERMIFLSSSTLVGATIGVLISNWIPLWLEFTLVGIATGVLLFTVTRHHIPFRRKGEISYFIYGCLLFILLIVGKMFIG